jgi:hypothetical protein
MQPVGVNPLDTSKHIAFNDPRQILADCEADLTLLELHSHRVWDVCRGCGLKAPCGTARTLAARYRHRPGYQPSSWHGWNIGTRETITADPASSTYVRLSLNAKTAPRHERETASSH